MPLPRVWTNGVDSLCTFSGDRVYRYELIRKLSGCPSVRVAIGINPSVADETKDDPTVRRLVKAAYEAGCGTFVMLNLFAFRSTDPAGMLRHDEPIGRDTDIYIASWAALAHSIILCWGAHGSHLGRSRQVLDMLEPHRDKLRHFGLTRSGQPRHPLYLPKNTPLKKWADE